MEKNTLILIDASALIYRAYYGLPPLTTKDGVLINAAYGFTSAIFSAIKALRPEYLVVAFDSKSPTFRHKEYKEYKATRKKAPDELKNQIPFAREICKVLNFPYFEAPGFEADDIIGTICEGLRIKRQELSKKQKLNPYHSRLQRLSVTMAGVVPLTTYIVTGDMDTLQLVDDNTFVYSMARGVNKAIVYDKKAVIEKYGFGPEHITDFKGLHGDPSDNIPGVPGIGQKTAAKLIDQFGSIENIYKKANNLIKPKILNLLLEHKDQAFLSKKLATLSFDAPCKFNLSEAEIRNYDKEKAVAYFTKLGFKSLIARLPEAKKQEKQQSLF